MLDNLTRHTSHSVSNPDHLSATNYEKPSGLDTVTQQKSSSEAHHHPSRRMDGSYATAFVHPRSTRNSLQPNTYAMSTDGPLTASVNANGEDETGSSTKSLDLERTLLESGAQTAVQRASLPALHPANSFMASHQGQPNASYLDDHHKHNGDIDQQNYVNNNNSSDNNSASGTDRSYGQKRLVVNAPKSWKGRLLGPMEPMELSSVSKKPHATKPSRSSQFYGLPKVYDVPRGVSSLMTAPVAPSKANEPEQNLPSLTEDSRLAHAVANDPVGPRFTATTPDYHHAAVPTHYDHCYSSGSEAHNHPIIAPQYQNYMAPNEPYLSSRAYGPPESGTAGHELNGGEYVSPSIPAGDYRQSHSYPQIRTNSATEAGNVGHLHNSIPLNGSPHSQTHPQTHPQTHRSLPTLATNTSGPGGSLANNSNGMGMKLNQSGVVDNGGYTNGVSLNYEGPSLGTPTANEPHPGHVLHDITSGGSSGGPHHLGSQVKSDQPPVMAYPVLFVPNSQGFSHTNGRFEPLASEYSQFGNDLRHKDRDHVLLANGTEVSALPHPLQALQSYQSQSTTGVAPMTNHLGASTFSGNPADGGQLDDPVSSSNQRSAGETKSHHCTYPGCSWSFARSSDFKRHLRSHGKPSLRCPYWQVEPACSKKAGLFYRLDVLKRHLKLVHSIRSTDGTNDGGECRVCSQHFDTTREFIDHCEKCAKEKSNSLGHPPGEH